MINYLFIIASFIIWSSYGLLIKFFNLNPFALIFYLSISGYIYIYYYIKKKSIKINVDKKSLLLIILASFLLFGNTITYFYALKFTSITNTILSHYAAPIIAAFFIPFFLKEKISNQTIISLFFSLIGIFMIFFPKGKIQINHYYDFIGILFGLLSAFCYAFLIIVGKYLIKDIYPITLMLYENIFSIVIIFLLFPIIKKDLIVTFKILILYFILGLTHNFIAPLLYLKGLKNIKAQYAAVLGYVEPVSAIIMEIIFLHYIPKIGTIFGGLLIIISGIYIIYNELK